MIKSIQVENFKCFKDMERLHCAPITLIYGPNSSGKSTICQALRILYEQICKVDRSGRQWTEPTLCKYAMELGDGNFSRLVHGQEDGGTYRIALRWMIPKEQEDFLPEGCESTAFCEFEYDGGILRGIRLGYGDNTERFCLSLTDRRREKGWRGSAQMYWHDMPKLRRLHNTLSLEHNVKPSYDDFISGLNAKSAEGLVAVRNIAAGWCVLGEKRLRKRWAAAPMKNEMINGSGPYRSEIRAVINGEMRAFRKALHAQLNALVFIGPQRKNAPSMIRSPSSLGSQTSSGAIGESEKVAQILFNTPKIVAAVNRWMQRLEIRYEVFVEEDLTAAGTQLEIKLREITSGRQLPLSLQNVGFGVGQLLPIITQALVSTNRVIVIDEPEVHLHPKLQAAIGDLFVESAKQRGNQFIIETHSENLALRLLRRLREASQPQTEPSELAVAKEDFSVAYANPSPPSSKIQQLRVDRTGEFIDRWPQGFFEERMEELF